MINGERQDDEGRDENVLFENAGMHGDERRRRRGGRRRQGRQLWQHQSCQPDRRKDQHSARECGASAPDFDNELQVASQDQVRRLRHLTASILAHSSPRVPSRKSMALSVAATEIAASKRAARVGHETRLCID